MARRENRLVLLDSVDVGLSHKMMVLVRPVFRNGVPEESSFWGYIVFAVDQREVMSSANISNLGKQKLDYTLYHKNSWEEEPHLVKELGRTEEEILMRSGSLQGTCGPSSFGPREAM